MNYKETLEKCRKENISIYDAMIANEVDFFFGATGGRQRPDFEQLCELAANAYLKVDTTTSISQVVDALRTLLDEGEDINYISHNDIIDHIQY